MLSILSKQKASTMFLFKEMLDLTLCKNNPEAIIVFGDNLLGKGKAGQAIIRDEPNSFGVPTKRLPSMNTDAFFSDREDEYEVIKQKLTYLWRQHDSGKTIILPVNKIGSGLANISSKSPRVSALIDRFYSSAQRAITLDSEFNLMSDSEREVAVKSLATLLEGTQTLRLE